MVKDYRELFEQCKNEIFEALELEKAKLIASSYTNLSRRESWMVEDGVFEYSDWTDVLYNELLQRFHEIILDKSKEMIVDLCRLKGFKSERKALDITTFGDHKTKTTPIYIDNGSEKTYCNVRSTVELSDDPRLKMYAEAVISDCDCDKYIVVFLQWTNPRTMSCRNRLLSGRFKNCPNRLSMLFFDEFLKQYFGQKVLKEFRKSMATFKSEYQEKLGYKITELCSERVLNRFKEETEHTLRMFDYHALLPEGINRSQIAKLDNNYLGRNRVKLMVGTGDFAKSFITSEWLYKKYVFSKELDNTYIVAGYLKSVEQLLFDIIIIEGGGQRNQSQRLLFNNCFSG